MADGTLAEAVEALAQLAADRRTDPCPIKVASVRDVLTSFGTALRDNPGLGGAALGGLGGAALGGFGTAVGNHNREDKRSVLGGALTGGLAGAGLGAGAGMAAKGISGLKGPGGGGDSPLAPGAFSDHGGGTISPEALKNNPELAAKMQELTAGRPWLERAVLGAGNAVGWLHDQAPVTTTIGMITAPLDVAMHSNQLRLGDRNWLHGPAAVLGGQRTSVGRGLAAAGNWLRDKGVTPGMIDPRNSTRIDHMREGLDKMLANADAHGLSEAQKSLIKRLRGDTVEYLVPGKHPGVVQKVKGAPGAAELEALNANRNPGEYTRDVTTKTEVPVKVRLTEDIEDRATGKIDPTRRKIKTQMSTKTVDSTAPATLSEEQLRTARNEGAKHIAGEYGKNKGLGEGVYSQPRVYRGLFGGTRDLPQGPLAGWRGFRRGAFYLGAPFLEYGLNSSWEEQSRKEEIADIVKRLREQGHIKPVGG